MGVDPKLRVVVGVSLCSGRQKRGECCIMAMDLKRRGSVAWSVFRMLDIVHELLSTGKQATQRDIYYRVSMQTQGGCPWRLGLLVFEVVGGFACRL